MPRVDEACADLADQIAAEDRQDHVVVATGLNMLNNGKLSSPAGTLPLTERAVEGLAYFTTPGGASYLKSCPPDLRAHNFNEWFPKALREDKRATTKVRDEALAVYQKRVEVLGADNVEPHVEPEPVLVPKQVTLRTRRNGTSGGREAFTVVGPRYGAFDIDKIAAQVAKGAPEDARCDITYDGYKARINVLFHSNIQPENAVAGEIFKAGLCVTTDDSGSGAIKISVELLRNLCLNLIILDNAKLKIGSRRHMGSFDTIAADVAEMTTTAMSKIGHFVNRWSESNVESVLFKYGLESMEVVFDRLVRNRVVHVPGVKPEDMTKKLLDAFAYEPFSTKSGVLNAITRAAHQESWKSPWVTMDLEEKAGELLWAKSWDMSDPDGEDEELQYQTVSTLA